MKTAFAVGAMLIVACGDGGPAPPLPSPSGTPVCPLPEQDPRPAQLSVWSSTGLVRYSDGSARCWGSNGNAQCTVTEYTGKWYWPGLANQIDCAASLAVGSFGGIATYADGAVRVWSAVPEVLAPTEDPDAEPGVPTRVNGLDGAKSVTAGERVAFAIRDDDVAVWWGVFPYYPVALATEPTPVPGLPLDCCTHSERWRSPARRVNAGGEDLTRLSCAPAAHRFSGGLSDE